MTNTPTPRTDAEEFSPMGFPVVGVHFARTLERELAAANRHCGQLMAKADRYDAAKAESATLRAALATVDSRVATLREALEIAERFVINQPNGEARAFVQSTISAALAGGAK